MGGRLSISVVLAFAALSMSTCGPQTPADEAYWNGCRAGRADTGGTISTYAARDDPRYSKDADYRKAWDNGYTLCFNEKYLYGGR